MTYLVTIIRGDHTITEEVDAYSQDQARQIMKEEIGNFLTWMQEKKCPIGDLR